MEQQNNNFFIGTDDLIKDDNLNDFRTLLLMKITALTQERGYAFCSNKYLADLFGKDILTISRNINFLIKNDYLIAKYDEKNDRRLVLTKMYRAIDKNVNPPIDKNVNPPIDKNVNHNNKVFNNKNNNNKATAKQVNLIKDLEKRINKKTKSNYDELTKETASIVIEHLKQQVETNKKQERFNYENKFE